MLTVCLVYALCSVCVRVLQRVREMVEARLASAPPDAIAAAAAASMDPTAAAAATAATSNSSLLPAGFSPAQEVLDTTLNRVLIVNVTTLEELNTWMSKLDVMVRCLCSCWCFFWRGQVSLGCFCT